uniref:amidohydrolase family protein n=1 Tax=Herbiconiux sp. TaxID=1871186 RepID=UPI0025C03A06
MLIIHDAARIVIDADTELGPGDFAVGSTVPDEQPHEQPYPQLGAPAVSRPTTPLDQPHQQPGAQLDPQSPAPTTEHLDASGCIITPGLVNAHHHLLQTAFRTLPGTRGVPMHVWLPTMAAAYSAVGIDPELAHAAARAGIAEGLLGGVTTVADHH